MSISFLCFQALCATCRSRIRRAQKRSHQVGVAVKTDRIRCPERHSWAIQSRIRPVQIPARDCRSTMEWGRRLELASREHRSGVGIASRKRRHGCCSLRSRPGASVGLDIANLVPRKACCVRPGMGVAPGRTRLRHIVLASRRFIRIVRDSWRVTSVQLVGFALADHSMMALSAATERSASADPRELTNPRNGIGTEGRPLRAICAPSRDRSAFRLHVLHERCYNEAPSPELNTPPNFVDKSLVCMGSVLDSGIPSVDWGHVCPKKAQPIRLGQRAGGRQVERLPCGLSLL